MALTPDLIKAQDTLADLSEDQVASLVTLSTNNEDEVIGNKVGEIHGAYDKDVKEITGVERDEGEKSYDYVKRVLGSYKEKAGSSEELQSKMEQQKTVITDLEKKIKEGSQDSALKQKLQDAETKLGNLQTQYDQEKTAWSEKEQEYEGKVKQVHVDVAFEKAKAGLKFKPGFPESVQDTLFENAKNTILSELTPDWEEKDGQRNLILRDKEGKIVTNPTNLQNAITPQELLATKLSEVIDTGRKQEGAGSKGTKGDTGNFSADISGAKNQVEADDIIAEILLKEGLSRGTPEFAEKQKLMRTDNEVSKLPMR